MPPRRKKASGHPARRAVPAADRSVLREFGAWLERQSEISAPTVEDETALFEALLTLARRSGIDLHKPEGVDDIIEMLFDADDSDAPEVLDAALDTLHDYVHFRLDGSRDPDAWEEAHEIVEDALAESRPGSDAIAHAIDAAAEIDEDERRTALADVHVIAAVSEVLEWMGTGRRVSPSGGVRRADIEQVAGMLGISAVGVSKRPVDSDITPLFDVNAPAPVPEAIHALSMRDVPALSAWWESLIVSEVIETTSTRVRPGSAASDWIAEALPPLELAEMVAGVFIANVLTEGMERMSGMLEESVVDEVIRRLMRALAPELADDDDPGFLGGLLLPRVLRKLRYLEDAGLLESADDGEPVVPAPLLAVVARGVLLTTAFRARAAEELED